MSEDKLDYLTKDEPKDTHKQDYLKPVEPKYSPNSDAMREPKKTKDEPDIFIKIKEEEKPDYSKPDEPKYPKPQK